MEQKIQSTGGDPPLNKGTHFLERSFRKQIGNLKKPARKYVRFWTSRRTIITGVGIAIAVWIISMQHYVLHVRPLPEGARYTIGGDGIVKAYAQKTVRAGMYSFYRND